MNIEIERFREPTHWAPGKALRRDNEPKNHTPWGWILLVFLGAAVIIRLFLKGGA